MASKTPSPRFVLGLAIVFVAMSAYPFFTAWDAQRLIGASEISTCEVLSKKVESYDDPDGSSNGYYPYVEIAHTIEGQRYVRVDSGKRFITQSDAHQAISQILVGSQLECRYVAGSPADVVLLEQADGQVPGMLIFGVLLWVIPLGIFLWARTRPGWGSPRRATKS
jgi:hypothetical protein